MSRAGLVDALPFAIFVAAILAWCIGDVLLRRRERRAPDPFPSFARDLHRSVFGEDERLSRLVGRDEHARRDSRADVARMAAERPEVRW